MAGCTELVIINTAYNNFSIIFQFCWLIKNFLRKKAGKFSTFEAGNQ